MPRQKKPEKVDTVYFHETGTVIEIMQDRNDYTFYAVYQGERCGSAVKAEMPKLVKELYARLHVPLEWQRVIIIHLQPPDHYGEVSLEFKCVEWAHRPSDHRIMERSVSFGSDYANPSQADIEKVYTGQPTVWQGWYYGYTIPGVTDHLKSNNDMSRLTTEQQSSYLKTPLYGRTSAMLDYTPELWASLKRIRAMIRRLGEELHRVVGTPEGNLDLLMFAIAPLLPAPADQAERDEAKTLENWEALEWQRNTKPDSEAES